MSRIFFITHPEVVIDPNVPVPQWGLSDEGRNRAMSLLGHPWVKEINLIYSSEELKAHQTAEIIANHLNLEVRTNSKLGEVDRSSTGFLHEPDLSKTVKEFFENPDKSIAGWESAEMAQKRIAHCVENIISTNPPANIAFISHGMVGGLLMSYLKKIPIHRRYMQRNLGSYFIYDIDEHEVVQEWRNIDSN